MELDSVFQHLVVVKRSGQRVSFNGPKIAVAIKLAFEDVNDNINEKDVNKVYNAVLNYISHEYKNRKTITVEDIQDIIENSLKESGFVSVYQSFNEYRLRRTASREAFSVKEQHKFVKAIEKIGLTVKNNQDSKPLDLIFKFGKTISREFAEAYLLDSKYIRANDEGRIAIKNLDAYALGVTDSSHLKLTAGNLRIRGFTHKIVETLKNFKEEQYGEQTIIDIDLAYAESIKLEFKYIFKQYLENGLKVSGLYEYLDMDSINLEIDNISSISEFNLDHYTLNKQFKSVIDLTYSMTFKELEKIIDESINFLLVSLSLFHFKMASNKVSISLGQAKSLEEKLFLKRFLNIYSNFKVIPFVEVIFKYKEDVDVDILDILALNILNKRNIIILYPDNISFDENIECFSTGVIINKNINSDINTSKGKILLGTVAINLVRIALKHTINNLKEFYEELEDTLELCKNQLLQRYENQANKYQENYEHIFKDNLLYDSWKLEEHQKIRKVLRNGTFNIGIVGLGECVGALKNKEVERAEDFNLYLDIINFINKKVQEYTLDNKLNFVLSEIDSVKTRDFLLTLDKTIYGNVRFFPKEQYSLLSDYLNKLELNEILKIGSKLQDKCNFALKVVLLKNSSKNKVLELIQNAYKNKIKTLKVQVGKNDN